MKVDFFRHNIGQAEIRACEKVLRSLFLTTGSSVAQFEHDLARYFGAEAAVGVTSCTAALHLALTAAGVKAGDEVITTPMSFVATANAICMAGAVPVFVDVERNTGNIDAALIESAITKKTKAILPVHLYGQMVDMKRILAIAKRHKLAVIEDAAHALESARDGLRPGTGSFGACLSFYATKSITSGEGGAFVTQYPEYARHVTQLRSHGITSELAQRERTGLKTYDVDRLGWKYNMDNIQAALLIPQLKKAEQWRKKRARIARSYRHAFEKLDIEMPIDITNSVHAHHIFPIWVRKDRRDAILRYLGEHGVGAVINYPAIHLFSFFRKKFGLKKGDFPHTEEIADRTISLPIFPSLTDKEIKHVIRVVTDAVREA